MAGDEYRAAVEPLLDLGEDDLLVRLADDVALGVGPLDPNRKRSIARAWLDARREELRDSVCGNARIQLLRETAEDDNVELAAAVADLVAGVTGKLPAATVAVLMVKTGLDSYCA